MHRLVLIASLLAFVSVAPPLAAQSQLEQMDADIARQNANQSRTNEAIRDLQQRELAERARKCESNDGEFSNGYCRPRKSSTPSRTARSEECGLGCWAGRIVVHACPFSSGRRDLT